MNGRTARVLRLQASPAPVQLALLAPLPEPPDSSGLDRSAAEAWRARAEQVVEAVPAGSALRRAVEHTLQAASTVGAWLGPAEHALGRAVDLCPAYAREVGRAEEEAGGAEAPSLTTYYAAFHLLLAEGVLGALRSSSWLRAERLPQRPRLPWHARRLGAVLERRPELVEALRAMARDRLARGEWSGVKPSAALYDGALSPVAWLVPAAEVLERPGGVRLCACPLAGHRPPARSSPGGHGLIIDPDGKARCRCTLPRGGVPFEGHARSRPDGGLVLLPGRRVLAQLGLAGRAPPPPTPTTDAERKAPGGSDLEVCDIARARVLAKRVLAHHHRANPGPVHVVPPAYTAITGYRPGPCNRSWEPVPPLERAAALMRAALASRLDPDVPTGGLALEALEERKTRRHLVERHGGQPEVRPYALAPAYRGERRRLDADAFAGTGGAERQAAWSAVAPLRRLARAARDALSPGAARALKLAHAAAALVQRVATAGRDPCAVLYLPPLPVERYGSAVLSRVSSYHEPFTRRGADGRPVMVHRPDKGEPEVQTHLLVQFDLADEPTDGEGLYRSLTQAARALVRPLACEPDLAGPWALVVDSPTTCYLLAELREPRAEPETLWGCPAWRLLLARIAATVERAVRRAGATVRWRPSGSSPEALYRLPGLFAAPGTSSGVIVARLVAMRVRRVRDRLPRSSRLRPEALMEEGRERDRERLRYVRRLGPRLRPFVMA